MLVAMIFSLMVMMCVLMVGRWLFPYYRRIIMVPKKLLHWVEDRVHNHQLLRVPQLNHHSSYSQQNPFYAKVSSYLTSLAPLQDSDFTNLFAGASNDIILSVDPNQTVHDEFLGARVTWYHQHPHPYMAADGTCNGFVLRIKKKDKRRILRSYLQHIHTVSDVHRELKLCLNSNQRHNRRWKSFPLTHPATMDTVAMDSDLKHKVLSDLQQFLKSKHYYHRLGRVWKRTYLLHGPSGTGKSTFTAAMAKFLSYDVYDLDIHRVSNDTDLKMLLLQTTSKAVIVIEDLDRFLSEKSTAVSFSCMLSLMDGIMNSCCGDERIFVFTANNKDLLDPAILRPGRIDVHIHFPLCDFNSFKSLANTYLGLKEHKLFPQVEEVFDKGAALSAAEIGEIMIANRSSPSRALKTVMTALQAKGYVAASGRRMMSESASSRKPAAEEVAGSGSFKDSSSSSVRPPPAKERRKLYSLLRLKSTNKIGPSDDDATEISSR